MHDTALSSDEIRRYSRQLILSNWSSKKQLRLRSLAVQVSHPGTALYLAAAGVGEIVLGETKRLEIPLESLRELCPHTKILLGTEIPQAGRPIDCAVLNEHHKHSVPAGIPTFIISDAGVLRRLEGEPVLVLPFPPGYRAADQFGGELGAAALGAFALLKWIADSPLEGSGPIPQ